MSHLLARNHRKAGILATMLGEVSPGSAEMSDSHQGSCLCGAVRFRTRGALRGVVYCHCSQCRKQSGHFYAATNVADADIVIEGTESITWYEASAFAGRGFCKTCGSVLFWKPRA